MRRIVALAAALVMGVAALVAMGAGDSSPDRYRVDAIFDNTGFLVPGQDVKIAGAKVGKVAGIRLTKDRQGLVEMEIDPGFAPFRADADCTVQPQSLIGERFIQCYPGSAARGMLADGPGGVPTVPITGTHSPVDLDLVLMTFEGSMPERLSLLLSSLGAGLAGRGEDLNAIIRRANPALQQSARVLRTVNANRTELRSLIANADTVVGELAERNRDVARFVQSSGDLAATTAGRRRELAATVRDLPKVLEALPGYLDAVETTLDVAPPDLDALRASAAPVRRLLGEVRTLATDTRPTVRELRTTARKARLLIPATRPVLARLDRFTKSALPASALIEELASSSLDRGVVEGAQSFVYYATAATARFDGKSHLLGAYPIIEGTCSVYATVRLPQCDSHFEAFKGGAGTPARTREQRRGKRKVAAQPGGRPAPAPAAQPAPAAPSPTDPAVPPAGSLPQLLESLTGLLAPGAKTTPPAPGAATPPRTAADLLGFLLG